MRLVLSLLLAAASAVAQVDEFHEAKPMDAPDLPSQAPVAPSRLVASPVSDGKIIGRSLAPKDILSGKEIEGAQPKEVADGVFYAKDGLASVSPRTSAAIYEALKEEFPDVVDLPIPYDRYSPIGSAIRLVLKMKDDTPIGQQLVVWRKLMKLRRIALKDLIEKKPKPSE